MFYLFRLINYIYVCVCVCVCVWERENVHAVCKFTEVSDIEEHLNQIFSSFLPLSLP